MVIIDFLTYFIITPKENCFLQSVQMASQKLRKTSTVSWKNMNQYILTRIKCASDEPFGPSKTSVLPLSKLFILVWLHAMTRNPHASPQILLLQKGIFPLFKFFFINASFMSFGFKLNKRKLKQNKMILQQLVSFLFFFIQALLPQSGLGRRVTSRRPPLKYYFQLQIHMCTVSLSLSPPPLLM